MSIDKLIDQIGAMAAINGSEEHAQHFDALRQIGDELASQMAEMQQAITGKDATLAEMQQTMTTKEAQMAEMMEKAQAAETAWQEEANQRSTKFDEMMAAIEKATARYKEALLTANPDVPAELVSGYSVDELHDSMERAKAIVEQIRQQEAERMTMPAGAPARGQTDTSGMSAREKIVHGLAH